jgi:branched-chain amino acid aminotransferase
MSMADRDGLIWFDGKLVPWRDAKVHVLTHTLHYGMGVFEGVRAYETESRGTCIFRLKEHTNRLFDSAKIMNIALPFSKDEVNEAQCAAVRENKLPSAYIRPMVFLGAEAMGLRAKGLKVHVIVAAWSWGSYMGEEALKTGIKVRTSSYTRHHVNISMTRAKANGHYINSMLALNEALSGGADEALLLDPEGYVAEGSGENVFIVKDQTIYTPELTACLNGITRNTIFHLAKEFGYEVVEKRITRDEIYIADEAFFTGTAAEVTPIRELDDRTIGTGKRGAITEKLQSLYFNLVKGRSQLHPEWLTSVK